MISVLMSTFNPIEKYFIQSLESILNQTYKNFEIIIVDDGSDINVEEIVLKHFPKIKKIKIIKLSENVGLPKALNIGLKECNGEYIARMDDDDIMTDNRLECMLNFVKENEYAGCWSWYERIDKNNKRVSIKKIIIKDNNFLKQLINRGNIFCHSTFFIKKEVMLELKGYDENLRYAQDSELYIRILDNYKMGIIPQILLKSRINDYRNNYYRETLSLTYALFGVMNYYTNPNTKNKKNRISLLIRIIRYYVGILKIEKKNCKN